MRSRRRAVCGVLVALLTAAAAVVAVQPAAAQVTESDIQRVGLWSNVGPNALVSEGTTITVTAELKKANNTGKALSIPIRHVPAEGVSAGWSVSADDLNMPSSISIANGARTGSVSVTIVDDAAREEFERGIIQMGQLPRDVYEALPSQSRGSRTLHFWIRPSDHSDLGRMMFRVCMAANNACPVDGDAGWTETTTPSLTLTEGGSAQSYQYKFTRPLTRYHELEVLAGGVGRIFEGNADRDRLTCVASADHARFPAGSLTFAVFGSDSPSYCPHLRNVLSWDELETWQTVTFQAGHDSDTLDHRVTVRHQILARITGHPHQGHFFQDPSGERWPVTITITDDDAPDQDVQFSAGTNGSTWINMNDGGGVDSALPDVLVPGETYSFRVRLKNRNLAPSQRYILTLRSESHWRDVKMSLVWHNGAEDAQWFQRLDFKTSSKRNRVYTVRVHVAADAAAGNVVFDQYTPPGFWARAAEPSTQWNRHYSRATVACIGCPDSDDGPILDSDDAPISDSNDGLVGDPNSARLDEAALIAEVNAHIADFASRNHANGVRDWTLILDRLEGRTGMSDADIAAWYERSVRHGWQDAITTLPKVQAALAAPQPVVVPEVNITSSAGGSEGSDVSFTVTADPPPTANLAVSVAVSASGDFGVPTGSHTVTIPAGQSSVTLTLPSSDDSVDEPDGSVTLTLNSGGGYTVGSLSSQSVQVLDDDDAPQVIAPVVSVSAGGGVSEGGAASFTLTASPAPTNPITVSVTVAASGDFGAVTGSRTVSIPTGGSVSFSVATADDSVDEADGSVSVTVADGTDYDVGTATATVSVADDDDPPPENVPDTDDVPDQNSVDPNQPVEVPDTDQVPDTNQVPADGDACTGKPTVAAADATAQRGDDLEFVISLDCIYSSDVDVHYTIAHGLTYADGGSVTISSGETTATVRAPTIGASDVGLYLVWVTEVTNPSGIWAYGTITD